MARTSLRLGAAALALSLLLLALRWFGRDARPGENDFDPVAAGVMFGSIGLAAPLIVAALVGLVCSAAALAARERPVASAVWGLAGSVCSVGLLVLAWKIGP